MRVIFHLPRVTCSPLQPSPLWHYQDILSEFALVFDAVYTPIETRLLREAAAAGAATVSGLEMFIGQAGRQFELFTGKPGKDKLHMFRKLCCHQGHDFRLLVARSRAVYL